MCLVLDGSAIHSRVSQKPAIPEGGGVTIPEVIALVRSALLDALDAPTVLERENQREGRSDLSEREKQGERGTIGQPLSIV
ncbi:UNVERIFIED_CONTAM: hypothetical protein FKN15_001494 [Acipenser sinensis]